MVSWFHDFKTKFTYLSRYTFQNQEIMNYQGILFEGFTVSWSSQTRCDRGATFSWIGKFAFHEIGDDAIGSRISLVEV